MKAKILSLSTLIILIASCNIDFKESVQVSLNIQEAKDKKVFVSEYKLENIQQLDNNYNFPISSVWEEKYWQLVLDEKENITYKISESSSHNLVFKLNNNDTLLSEPNFIKGKWIIFMDNKDNPIGSTRGMINIDLLGKSINDTTLCTIFKQNIQYNIKSNLTPLFKFILIRKG